MRLRNMGIDIGNRNNTVSTGAQTLKTDYIVTILIKMKICRLFDGEILNPERPLASDLSQLNTDTVKSCNI